MNTIINSIVELKDMFPKGKCNRFNYIVPRPNAIYGSGQTFGELREKGYGEFSFFILKPRIGETLRGAIFVDRISDIDYLEKLVESSKKFVEIAFSCIETPSFQDIMNWNGDWL